MKILLGDCSTKAGRGYFQTNNWEWGFMQN